VSAWALVLAVLLFCSSGRAEDQHCPRGARTTLTIERRERTELLRPDEAIGGDQLILRAGKRELMHTVSHDFHWVCLAFSKKRGHLVGSRAVMDGALVLRTIGYLAEDATVIEASAFTRERFHAYAALPSRDGRWVAFVGGRDGLALYVLDTTRDRIRKLGPAPAPPNALACEDWSCVNGQVELASWRFQKNALVVRYDDRTATRHRSKRTQRRFRL
jgi:hypothetical protein